MHCSCFINGHLLECVTIIGKMHCLYCRRHNNYKEYGLVIIALLSHCHLRSPLYVSWTPAHFNFISIPMMTYKIRISFISQYRINFTVPKLSFFPVTLFMRFKVHVYGPYNIFNSVVYHCNLHFIKVSYTCCKRLKMEQAASCCVRKHSPFLVLFNH